MEFSAFIKANSISFPNYIYLVASEYANLLKYYYPAVTWPVIFRGKYIKHRSYVLRRTCYGN